MKIPNTKSTL